MSSCNDIRDCLKHGGNLKMRCDCIKVPGNKVIEICVKLIPYKLNIWVC